MATVTYAQLIRRRDLAMRRTAPPTGKPTSSFKDGEGRRQSAPQLSKLQQMQADYQQKLMKEKEDKLIAMQQTSQDQSGLELPRVKRSNKISAGSGKKQGVVRKFFKERRQLEKDGRLDGLHPGSHLQKMRSEQMTLHEQEQHKQDELMKYTSRQRPNQLKPKLQKVGYSKSKLLAPIKPHSAERTVHRQASERLISRDGEYQMVNTNRAGLGFQGKSSSEGAIGSKRHSRHKGVDNANRNSVIATPPRKPLPKVTPGKRHSSPAHQREETPKESKKLSDFQNWQAEQDEEREARLHKYEGNLKEDRKAKPLSFDMSRDDEESEGENEHARVDPNINPHHGHRQEYEDTSKEKELEAMILKHRLELEQLQTDDLSDDEDDISDTLTERAYRMQHNEDEDEWKTAPKGHVGDYNKYEDRYGYEDEENQIDSPVDPPQSTDLDEEEELRSVRNTKSELGKQRGYNSPDRYQSHTKRPPVLNEGTKIYAQAASGETDETSHLDLRPCQICGRKFAVDRLATHKKICKKNSNTKRKVFDSMKHRTEGTDMSQFVRYGQHLKQPKKNKVNNWKKKHEDFVRAIKDAQMVQAYIAKGGKASDLPPPPPSENPDYKQCPYCNRRFNPTAAERHIPHCKDTKSRPKPPPNRRR